MATMLRAVRCCDVVRWPSFLLIARTQSLVKRCAAIQTRYDGGSGAIDVQSQVDALKLTWVARLLDASSQPWKAVPHPHQTLNFSIAT